MIETAAEGLTDLDRRVEAFEAAWAAGERPDLGRFLPPPCDPAFLSTLAELVRIDLELRTDRGEPARLDRYREAYPALFADRLRVQGLAFEEYRLRLASGDQLERTEYAARYGIDTSDWPTPKRTRTKFPEPGETILDFHLLSELGRGSFGRVYLAEQGGLARRRVAVKVSTRFGAAEPETLARLQHTHIVPIYSTHRAGPFQIIVMPFLGTSTLADLLVELRSRGSWPATGRELADTLAIRRSQTVPTSTEEQAAASKPVTVPAVAPDALGHFTFPEAVLWVGAKLADALAHAHERGVLHRDVKPANVLLTDDGQPMLLDFNLAADAGQVDSSGLGGTPAYMAPEQLRQVAGELATVDGRADLYALGIVLFELLTGRYPFRDVTTPANFLRGHSGPPPLLRPLNPAVTPSIEAIVRRCLESDPAKRYPSAHALAEDLERQLADQPLVYTREPSLRERFSKWRRRHPRLTSSGTVAAIAGVVVIAVSAAAFVGYERARHLERERAAVDQYRKYRVDVVAPIDLLAFHLDEPAKRIEGIERAKAILDRYETDDAGWEARPSVALLREEDRRELREQMTELLLLLARTEALTADQHDPPSRLAALNVSLDFTDRAASLYHGRPVPRSVWEDRANLLAQLGRSDEAARAGRVAEKSTWEQRDFYLTGLARLGEKKFADAVPLLDTAVRLDPKHYFAWIALGEAHTQLGRHTEAEGCFCAAIALRPDLPIGSNNRGLSRLRRKQFASAEADFTDVLRIDPDRTDALANRAIARLGQKRPGEAIADLTRALDLGAPETRLLLLRADARTEAGDAVGAATDRAAGLARTPTDDTSWVARGLARANAGDAAGALADFDAALKLNPRCFPALQNKAFVLDEILKRDTDAIAVLDRAIALFPDELFARAGRAVLLARRGERTAAHADAEHCLKRAPEPLTVYQLAGVYARSSKTHPEDARTAFRLLADALKQGAGFDLIDRDPDLEPLRSMLEFKLVVDAARVVHPRSE